MAKSDASFDLIGAGNPIMDLLAPVTDEFLRAHVAGDKGGMVMIDATELDRIVGNLAAEPARAPGGSASNATVGAARLGLRTTYLGKIGHDRTAETYLEQFRQLGIDTSRIKRGALPHARCLALVTPDGQRTMRTYLGAAMTLSPGEISADDFRAARHAHIEGYLLFNPDLATAVIESARAAGCSVSLDLASFEVVNVARDWIFSQVDRGVDVVFGNEDEIRALFSTSASTHSAYGDLARRLSDRGCIAAVKLGKDGAWIGAGGELHRVDPVPVSEAIDTTGAGDAWAAGFLYGYVKGWPLPSAGRLASHIGAETVQYLGPVVPQEHWPRLREVAGSIGQSHAG